MSPQNRDNKTDEKTDETHEIQNYKQYKQARTCFNYWNKQQVYNKDINNDDTDNGRKGKKRLPFLCRPPTSVFYARPRPASCSSRRSTCMRDEKQSIRQPHVPSLSPATFQI